MRYAIISDIHANVAALRGVLADAQDLKAEKIICLGDVLGYGPDPVATLEMVYSRAHICLAGNHDDAVCGRCSTEDFNDFAAAAISRQRRTLTQEALAWLKALPYVCALDGFACAHGDFSEPENFNYVQTSEDAVPSWAARQENLFFVGHTHEPGIFVLDGEGEPQWAAPQDFALAPGVRYLVNVGSVGYPRSGSGRSSYCIYDSDAKSVTFRSLPFDLEGYREKMGGKGLDEAPWMTARAASRATPLVRSRANFGKSAASPKRVKAITVEHSEARPVVAAELPPAKRSPWPAVMIVILLLGLGAALAGYFMTDRQNANAPQVVQVPPPRANVGVSARPVPAPAPAKKMAAAPAAKAKTATVASEAMLVKKQSLALQPGDKKVYFAVKLAPKSHPAKVRLRFKDAEGRLMPNEDVGPFPIKTSLAKRTNRNAIDVPDGAAGVTLEVHRIERMGLTEVASIELDSQELKKRK